MNQLAIPWDKLKEWISVQEQLESETGKPAPLTSAQYSAIHQLIPIFEEPDVSDQDYVSLLHQKMQVCRMPAPRFVEQNPIHFGGALRWRCVCILRQGEPGFPREGHGVESGQDPPTFQSKKNAKQYAAKFAWKNIESQMPHKIVRNPGPTQPQTPRKNNASFSAGSPSKRHLLSPGSSIIQAMTLSPTKANEDPSIFSEVSKLASELGHESPTYHIEPEDNDGFYRGRPEFKNRGPLPLDLGHVTQVFGKKQAKMQIAQKVLDWLKKDKERKEKLKAELLSL